jgi:hypothetical protein
MSPLTVDRSSIRSRLERRFASLAPVKSFTLGDLDWSTLMLGSPGGTGLNTQDYAKLEAAWAELDGEVGRRLYVMGREEVPADVDAQWFASLMDAARAATGAKRALLVIDYLQLLPVPPEIQKQGDIAADKHRAAIVKDAVTLAQSTVMAITEARKPQDSKTEWGATPQDLMGSSRLAFTADILILLYKPSPSELKRAYGLPNAAKETVATCLAALEKDGKTPVVVSLAKGRDGMRRGAWMVEFEYKRSKFRAVEVKPPATGGVLPGAKPKDDDDDQADGRAHSGGAGVLPGRRDGDGDRPGGGARP